MWTDALWHHRGSTPVDAASPAWWILDELERRLVCQGRRVSHIGPAKIAFDRRESFFRYDEAGTRLADDALKHLGRGAFTIRDVADGRRVLSYNLRSKDGPLLALLGLPAFIAIAITRTLDTSALASSVTFGRIAMNLIIAGFAYGLGMFGQYHFERRSAARSVRLLANSLSAYRSK